jgi:hypothetical protein
MEIRFISTLTAEDEERIAAQLLKALTALLDESSLAYTIRIETSGEQVFQHTHVAPPLTRRGSEATALAPGNPNA